MIYGEDNARRIAKVWRVGKPALSRWKRQNSIPDYRALYQPLDKAGLAVEDRLIRLVESGWLKARSISRLTGSGDRINALMTARRHPNDLRFHVKHLNSAEIIYLKPLLEQLQRSLGTLLYLASLTPEDQNYSEVIQADFRSLLRRKYINGANVRASMDNRQIARFWAFMRGNMASRKYLNEMILKLKILLELLTINKDASS
ncbi:hypothetical protein [Spirosoma validum]|uniref:Uncharacterized protein n=1 Tax=Spirosoma validum TaxID=2771355 RepID=A0A927GCF2_9BACT|nr:hypothetical protein [Spirosoma validum]MBD2752604.1 hypothetical protein [Spirosoma validum]